MKTKVGRIPGVMGLCVACLGLVPLAVSCSSRHSYKVAYERGLSHAEKGDHDKAIADLTEAIRLEPNNGLAHSCRATAYRALGDEVKAASDENRAQELKK